jgi:hypothetical protein
VIYKSDVIYEHFKYPPSKYHQYRVEGYEDYLYLDDKKQFNNKYPGMDFEGCAYARGWLDAKSDEGGFPRIHYHDDATYA